jgi:hypothetical protein
MTKISQPQSQQQDQEIDWAELLLRRFRKAEEVFEKARSFNRSKGYDEQLSKAYIRYEKPFQQRIYERWLAQVTNPDTGQFNTMKMLKTAGIVARGESEFDNKTYPRIELFQLHRIKTHSGQEYLRRVMMWYGLSQKGTEISRFVNDIDVEIIPAISYVPLEDSIQVGRMAEEESYRYGKRTIAKVENDNGIYSGIETGKTIFITPFTAEAVQEAIKYARGSFDDHYNGCTLELIDENKQHPIAVKSLEEFMQPFDIIWKKTQQPPTNINLKDLVDQLKPNKDAEQQEGKIVGQPYK